MNTQKPWTWQTLIARPGELIWMECKGNSNRQSQFSLEFILMSDRHCIFLARISSLFIIYFSKPIKIILMPRRIIYMAQQVSISILTVELFYISFRHMIIGHCSSIVSIKESILIIIIYIQ